MDIILKDEIRSQFLYGISLKPGSNFIEDKEWNKIKELPWTVYLLENKLLEIVKAPLLAEPVKDVISGSKRKSNS